jgi:hypothetical protein
MLMTLKEFEERQNADYESCVKSLNRDIIRTETILKEQIQGHQKNDDYILLKSMSVSSRMKEATKKEKMIIDKLINCKLCDKVKLQHELTKHREAYITWQPIYEMTLKSLHDRRLQGLKNISHSYKSIQGYKDEIIKMELRHEQQKIKGYAEEYKTYLNKLQVTKKPLDIISQIKTELAQGFADMSSQLEASTDYLATLRNE